MGQERVGDFDCLRYLELQALHRGSALGFGCSEARYSGMARSGCFACIASSFTSLEQVEIYLSRTAQEGWQAPVLSTKNFHRSNTWTGGQELRKLRIAVATRTSLRIESILVQRDPTKY